MPIQRIDHKGALGFQVRVGPRVNVWTKYFAVSKYGHDKALKLAQEAEAVMLKRHPGPLGRGPGHHLGGVTRSGIVGLRLLYVPSRTATAAPLLHIQVRWPSGGTQVSTQKHGVLEAVRIAMERREAATGTSYGLTPRQAWNILRQHANDSTNA